MYIWIYGSRLTRLKGEEAKKGKETKRKKNRKKEKKTPVADETKSWLKGRGKKRREKKKKGQKRKKDTCC